MKSKYTFRIYCNHCKNKIIDSNEITKKDWQFRKHICSKTVFEIGISKFKNNKVIK